MKWKDFLLKAGLSEVAFEGLDVEEKEILRAAFNSKKKIIIIRPSGQTRPLHA